MDATIQQALPGFGVIPYQPVINENDEMEKIFGNKFHIASDDLFGRSLHVIESVDGSVKKFMLRQSGETYDKNSSLTEFELEIIINANDQQNPLEVFSSNGAINNFKDFMNIKDGSLEFFTRAIKEKYPLEFEVTIKVLEVEI